MNRQKMISRYALDLYEDNEDQGRKYHKPAKIKQKSMHMEHDSPPKKFKEPVRKQKMNLDFEQSL